MTPSGGGGILRLMVDPFLNAAVAALVAAFPRDRVPKTTGLLYLQKLADLPPAALEAAVHELIATTTRFPTIAEIRALVAERTLRLPTDPEALGQLDALGEGVHPLVRSVRATMGGRHAYRAAENPDVWRGQFLRLYRDERARAIREAQVGRALPPGSRPLAAVS